MANFTDVEALDAKKRKIFWTVVLVLGLCLLVIFSSFIDKHEESSEIDATDAFIGVHVKGAVNNSGYYEVPYGTRIKDLAQFAGGFLPSADLDGVNLAAFVKDGEEVYIPHIGTPMTGAVNINTVTYEELIEINDIGDVTARRILNYRDSRGVIESVTELRSVLGVTKYEQLRENFYVLK